MFFEALRQKHRIFRYESFDISRERGNIILRFSFLLEPSFRFKPEVVITGLEQNQTNSLSLSTLENLTFHLGLIEMFSYWKAACSPEIIIEAGNLNEKQLEWWKVLLHRGMGEFFYVNNIDFTKADLISIRSLHTPRPWQALTLPSSSFSAAIESNPLLLLSGGKDSALSIHLLQQLKKRFTSLLLNPTEAALHLAERASTTMAPMIVKRAIDPQLLELNKAGYLNGHTPFSAYLAYLGLLGAFLCSGTEVIVSNERSAEEGNITFHGREINHQYSKSLEFETSFRSYVNTFLLPEVSYFSLVRPLYEIQIGALLSKCDRDLEIIRSCNRKQQTNSWCGVCPKCLSTFLTFAAHLPLQRVEAMFGKNLLADERLLPLLDSLLGREQHKPFECIGTKDETLAELFLCFQQCQKKNKENSLKELPVVLQYFKTKILPDYPNIEEKTHRLLTAWEEKHFLPKDYEYLLRTMFDEICRT